MVGLTESIEAQPAISEAFLKDNVGPNRIPPRRSTALGLTNRRETLSSRCLS